MPVAELIRQVGITEQTLYRWKTQYKGLETDQVRQFKQLQDENARLKRLVPDYAELVNDVSGAEYVFLHCARCGSEGGNEVGCRTECRFVVDSSVRGLAQVAEGNVLIKFLRQ